MICDVDDSTFGKAKQFVESKTGKAPVFQQDLRKVLEDKSIDIITVATPNHWHSLAAIWAIQAGKDVYVEKPVSHNVHEGRMVVQFARKHGRIVQTGSQSRSNPGMRQFIDYVRSGKLGKVTVARGLCYKGAAEHRQGGHARQAARHRELRPVAGAGRRRARTCPGSASTTTGTGSGTTATATSATRACTRWTRPAGAWARRRCRPRWSAWAAASATRTTARRPTPSSAFTTTATPSWCSRCAACKTDDFKGAKVGNIFHGTEGYAVSNSYSSGTIFDLKGQEGRPASTATATTSTTSSRRSARASTPTCTADVEEGHLSAALCHLGNISYRLGKTAPLGKKPTELVKIKEAEEAFARFEQHLTDNGVPLDKTSFKLGATLTVDPEDRDRSPTAPRSQRPAVPQAPQGLHRPPERLSITRAQRGAATRGAPVLLQIAPC